MPRYVVIADDLTGALDTAVQFADNGLGALVIRYRPENAGELFEFGAHNSSDEVWARNAGVPVMVVDIASRHLSAAEAATRVRRVVDAARNTGARTGDGPPRFYKKTDSALRGNVGGELDALLSAAEAEAVFFVPAYPQLGRTTVNGMQLIDGLPLEDSAFAHDERDPAKLSSVAQIVARQSTVPTQVVPTAQVYSGKVLERGPQRIIICDAETVSDIDAIGGWIRRQTVRYELAGCGGLAARISSVWRKEEMTGGKAAHVGLPQGAARGPAADVSPAVNEVASRGMLLVCGSRHPRSREQLRTAEETGIFSFSRSAEARFRAIASEDRPAGDPDTVARGLADAALCRMRERPPGVLTVFGGDTVAALLDVLEVRAIRPVYEFEAGVVVSEIDSCIVPKTRLLVTKAGGFGGEDLMLEMYRRFETLVARGVQCESQ